MIDKSNDMIGVEACDQTGLALIPERDVAMGESGPEATSAEPWLRLSSIADFQPGRWIAMRYAASLYDEPVRPILRFLMRDGSRKDVLAPAPCEGEAIWLGRAPPDLAALWICPTDRIGRFDFRILSIGPVPLGVSLRKALASPKRMFFSLSARMVGLHDEADLNLRWALGREEVSGYPAWSRERNRRSDGAVDRPRADWESAPVATIVLHVEGATPAAVEASRRSFLEQTYPRWRVLLEGGTAGFAASLGDGRFTRIEDGAPEVSNDLLCSLRAGDEFPPHGLACFVEHFARNPQETIAYADHCDAGPQGAPCFKPGWSPVLNAVSPYVGRAAMFRGALLRGEADSLARTPECLLDDLLARAEVSSVGRIARILFRLGAAPQPRRPARPASPERRPKARVSAIIPTRDRADLLRPCLDSLLSSVTDPDLDVIVVDNDSIEAATHRLFVETLRRDRRVRILPAPGPFNFSAICNRAAQEARGEFLLFLNNDTTALTPGWLESMLEFASMADVGAVGAKLLFPDNRVQHVGVVLGMGGVAGHFGSELGAAEEGWHGMNLHPHEASAVTGACLMVERRKFEAVSGFDAENLPIELNDIDLCLRLSRRGWRTICDTRAALMHHQSASRGGAAFRLQKTYAAERGYFIDKWRGTIRNDPYFNPAMSLYAHIPALA
ncbi:glycosyltransferase family 2 protein [Methylocystis heyeri]|uniref:Glycosyltransferase n=1 Tax=Methylocystis heyeri TaxID=391905 RepID=A0A6B8KFD1_9HYPH|nr:glycosyltransferase family 2 protein [Methylocystis heyeri]QGM45183.1 glycosyltransferase [Methylocystis heyeri]